MSRRCNDQESLVDAINCESRICKPTTPTTACLFFGALQVLGYKADIVQQMNVPGAPHGTCWWALHVLVKLLMRNANTLGEGNLAASEVVKIMFLARMGGKTSCDKERFLAVLADSKNGTAQPESRSLGLA